MKILNHVVNTYINVIYFRQLYSALRGCRSQKLLYENLPVLTKMVILSRRRILLAILLSEQFLHLTQINLHPNIQCLSTQQHAYQSFFWLLPGLIPFASLWHAG